MSLLCKETSGPVLNTEFPSRAVTLSFGIAVPVYIFLAQDQVITNSTLEICSASEWSSFYITKAKSSSSWCLNQEYNSFLFCAKYLFCPSLFYYLV